MQLNHSFWIILITPNSELENANVSLKKKKECKCYKKERKILQLNKGNLPKYIFFLILKKCIPIKEKYTEWSKTMLHKESFHTQLDDNQRCKWAIKIFERIRNLCDLYFFFVRGVWNILQHVLACEYSMSVLAPPASCLKREI